MRLEIDAERVRIKLAPWQKALGLMRGIEVPLAEVGAVRVVEDPMREVMAAGLKVGLRVPWLYYIARTIRLDQAFLVRRGIPALSFTVGGERTLRRVLVCTPHAGELAARLRESVPAAA